MGTPKHAGHLLRAAREAADLRQDAAAERLAISQQKISDFENGVYEPRRRELEAMLDLYGVPVDERGRFLAINSAPVDASADSSNTDTDTDGQ